MAMSMGTGGSVKAEPNVTPMIDVMLVLLIIFMLVVPAISAGFQAIPPQGTNLKPHPEEERDQVLGIDANGQVLDALDIAAHNDVRVTGMITDQKPGTISLIQTDRMIAGEKAGGKK